MSRRRKEVGRCLKRRLVIRVLMATLLPLPVEPAMRRWGILARSRTQISPSMLLPRTRGRRPLAFWKAGERTASEKRTSSLLGLGTSRPTVFLPGMGASIRTAPTARARARSFCRLWMRLIFSPGAGRSS
jgi:hypothetical protein